MRNILIRSLRMDKQKIENKTIYFISLLSMVCILVLIAYFFFMRNVEIDIMENAQYSYVGENGNASVVVNPKQGDLNQRMQDFLNSVKYEVSPNTDLSNGDTIHVTATYDEALDRCEYSIKIEYPVNTFKGQTIEKVYLYYIGQDNH